MNLDRQGNWKISADDGGLARTQVGQESRGSPVDLPASTFDYGSVLVVG